MHLFLHWRNKIKMKFWTSFCFLLTTIINNAKLSRDPVSEQLSNYMKTHEDRSTVLTASGAPVDGITSTLTVGPKGPVVVYDTVSLESFASFAREKIPPRNGPSKGSGAFGFFEVTNDITMYTKASLFSKIGKKTRTAVRFSLLGGDHGTPDTIRTPHGLAVKFYTADGILDLLCVSNPVLFVREPLQMIHFGHTQGRNPVTNLRDSNMVWDFYTKYPESMYLVLWQASDQGIPDGYRHMDCNGIVTYKLVNDEGEAVYFRFKWTTDQGFKGLSNSRASSLIISDPDYFTRDLYNAIAVGNLPSYTLRIQVMTFKQAEMYHYNPFDAARYWPQEEFPWIEVGKLTLNENPGNYHADVEQFAADPANIVSGVEPSPDKLLEARMFTYRPAQRYRIGTNYMQLPINRPFKDRAVTNYQRDGPSFQSAGAGPIHHPNSYCGPDNLPSAAFSDTYISGDVARYNSSEGDDTLDLAITFWSSQSEDQKRIIVQNLVFELGPAAPFIKKEAIKMFGRVDPDLAQRIDANLPIKD